MHLCTYALHLATNILGCTNSHTQVVCSSVNETNCDAALVLSVAVVVVVVTVEGLSV